ncbi:MAG TPA: hypothetical protein VIR57_23600 [Chloroflexota bacterium]
MKLPFLSKTEEDDPYWDFFLNSPLSDERNSVATALRKAPEGVVNPVKDDIHTPEVMSRHVKELSRFLGADLVGVAKTGRSDYPFAVMCLTRAQHDPRQSPGIGGQMPVQRGQFVTFIVSAWIRELGFQGTTKIEVDNDELATKAGLGTLNGEGRLVSPRYGANVHVSGAILTDLPLQPDA